MLSLQQCHERESCEVLHDDAQEYLLRSEDLSFAPTNLDYVR